MLRVPFLFVSLAMIFSFSCSSYSPSELFPSACNIQPGEILITELMPYPDPGQSEWLELKNNTARSISLEKAVLRVESGSAARYLQFGSGANIGAGQYWLVGEGAESDYLVPESIGLYNKAANVSLVCKQTVVDSMRYGQSPFDTPQKGVSLLLGSQSADVEHSQDKPGIRQWCSSYVDEDGNLGASPGMENHPCGSICIERGVWRAVTSPFPGTLILSEVLANPEGPDSGSEWLELKNISDEAVDLNGSRFVFYSPASGKERSWGIEEATCQAVLPQHYAVVSNSLNMEASDIVASGEDIFNDAFELRLETAHSVVLVEKLKASISGVSWQRDSVTSLSDSTFCLSRINKTSTIMGSPGDPNHPCGDVCMAETGWREISPPDDNALVITEIFSNPTGADDDRDWIEIYNAGPNNSFDLNNLVLKQKLDSANDTFRERLSTLNSVNCVGVTPGQFSTIAWSKAQNDGVKADFILVADDLYSSSNNRISLHWKDTEKSVAQVGASCSGHSQFLSTSDADPADFASWCFSTTPVGESFEFGSPGQSNEVCNFTQCNELP